MSLTISIFLRGINRKPKTVNRNKGNHSYPSKCSSVYKLFLTVQQKVFNNIWMFNGKTSQYDHPPTTRIRLKISFSLFERSELLATLFKKFDFSGSLYSFQSCKVSSAYFGKHVNGSLRFDPQMKSSLTLVSCPHL